MSSSTAKGPSSFPSFPRVARGGFHRAGPPRVNGVRSAAGDEASAAVEALGELQRAQNRRGEATSILLDDLPTFRYVAPLVYWNGRAQEGTGQHAAAMENYKTYLAIRSSAPGDPLVADARRRVGTP